MKSNRCIYHKSWIVYYRPFLRPGPSPMIFPSAHTACSHTLWCFEFNNCKKSATAPADTTACVCCDVPLLKYSFVSSLTKCLNYLAIFVSAQAASNWILGWSSRFKLSTRIGNIPEWIKSSIGGFRSDDRSFRAAKSISKVDRTRLIKQHSYIELHSVEFLDLVIVRY